MKKNRFLILIILFLIVIVKSFSQKLFTSVDTLRVKIGEPIHYYLQIEQKYDSKIIRSIINQLKKSKIELSSYLVDSNSLQNYICYDLNLISFESGEQVIPSFIFVIDNDSIKTTSYNIQIIETLVEENRTFQDIKNIEEVSLEFIERFLLYKNQIYIALGILILTLILYLIWKNYLKKKSRKTINSVSLLDRTIEKINQLKNKNYPERLKYRSFYIEFSHLVREYLSEYYFIPAKILLTDELLNFINRKQLISDHNYQFLSELLKISDSVKFAKFIPHRDVPIEQLEKFIQFIKDSKKKKEITKSRETISKKYEQFSILFSFLVFCFAFSSDIVDFS